MSPHNILDLNICVYIETGFKGKSWKDGQNLCDLQQKKIKKKKKSVNIKHKNYNLEHLSPEVIVCWMPLMHTPQSLKLLNRFFFTYRSFTLHLSALSANLGIKTYIDFYFERNINSSIQSLFHEKPIVLFFYYFP